MCNVVVFDFKEARTDPLDPPAQIGCRRVRLPHASWVPRKSARTNAVQGKTRARLVRPQPPPWAGWESRTRVFGVRGEKQQLLCCHHRRHLRLPQAPGPAPTNAGDRAYPSCGLGSSEALCPLSMLLPLRPLSSCPPSVRGLGAV